MAPRRYLNFDLLLDQEADGHYQALVTGSPLGETPIVRFQLPFDATTLENLLLKLDPGRSGTRRVGVNSRQQAAMEFGGPLYEAIFRDNLLLSWTRSQDSAREQGAGLRLRLKLTAAPAIAGLPWELLYDARSNCFLAQSEQTPLVRFLEVSRAPRPMSVDGPLHILVVISSPADLEPLDVEGEWHRMQQALEPQIRAGVVVLDRLPEPTVSSLGVWLRRHETHVIHMVGHGDFSQSLGEGVLYFQDRHGRSSSVTSSVLGPFIRDHDSLRMVVLNACRSARSDAVDPFGGMAQGLVQQDANAVLAMQFPITDRAAVSFTAALYGALVDGLPVDQATSSARKALLADHRDEWATPVLFMRSPDGYIFSNVHAVDRQDQLDTLILPRSQASEPQLSTSREEFNDEPAAVEPESESAFEPESEDLGSDDLRVSQRPSASEATSYGGWVRRRWPAVAALCLVAMVAAGASFLLPRWFDGAVELPQSEPLRDTEILLAAGDDPWSQSIWLIDVEDPTTPARLTEGGQESLPSLSPDRRTIVFARTAGEGVPFELWLAEAGTGSNTRRFFEEGTPDECRDGISRPAWLPDHDGQLIAGCTGRDGVNRLVSLDVAGTVINDLGSGPDDVASFGDPTVSPDGRFAIVWGSAEDRAWGGALYSIDLTTGDWDEVLPDDASLGPNGSFSDPAFSPDGSKLAFRENVGDGNFEITVAVVADGDGIALENRRPIVTAEGRDQDPMFSPDGTQIVYGHVEEIGKVQELRIVDTAGTSKPRSLVVSGAPGFQSFPAWTRR